jgi:ADP-ribose pyrophosphatase YjhB (NUDIX family)
MAQQRQNYRSPFLATDIIIEYDNGRKKGIVLVTRKNPPYGLAIPGGFAEWGLTLEQNAIKEAREETGLEVIIENPEHPLCVRSSPCRDPRGHMVSVTYIAKGIGTLNAGDDAKSAALYSIDELIPLAKSNHLVFDHSEILKEYLHYRGYLK